MLMHCRSASLGLDGREVAVPEGSAVDQSHRNSVGRFSNQSNADPFGRHPPRGPHPQSSARTTPAVSRGVHTEHRSYGRTWGQVVVDYPEVSAPAERPVWQVLELVRHSREAVTKTTSASRVFGQVATYS